jgi:tetratricopeptide (TPR) repeat protein
MLKKNAFCFVLAYKRAYNNLALLHTNLGEFNAAQDLYETLIDLFPDDYKGYYNLAVL